MTPPGKPPPLPLPTPAPSTARSRESREDTLVGPPSHISHALVGPRPTAAPPHSVPTQNALSTFVTDPAIDSLPPPSTVATHEDVSALKQDVIDGIARVNDTIASRTFVAQGEFAALRSTVSGLATQVLALTQAQGAVTRAVRQLDERRSQTEVHYETRDRAQDEKLARLSVWKYIGGGASLALVSHLLNQLQPLHWIGYFLAHRH